MRILLTGATGFLGSALARHWAQAGHTLVLLARPASRTNRLQGLPGNARLERCQAETDLGALVRDLAPQAIVHTACAYGRQGESALDLLDANVRLGLVLMQSLLAPAGEPVSFINTGSVLAPEVSLYALSKQQFSQWGQAMGHRHPQQLQFIDVRLQQMYGPGDESSKFTTHALRACRQNVAQLDLTPGEQQRDFIHIDDVVQAYDLILQRRTAFASADAIDVGSGQTVTMRHYVEAVRRLTGASTALNFGAVPYRPHEPMHCVADVARLRSLGWSPRFNLESGLQQTLQMETTP